MTAATTAPTPSHASQAFRDASLRSEVGRAYAVMGTIALVAVVVVSREFIGDIDDRIPMIAAVGGVVLLAVQLSVLFYARRARRQHRALPLWFSTATVVIESLVPSGIMMLQIVPGVLPPYASLAGPAVLAYGLLIALSTLRLRPMLCILAGVIASAGYSGVFMYVHHGLGIKTPTTGLPRAAYISTPLILLISGFACAWVAREIRTHLDAALTEAETRRKMDRLERDLTVAQSIQRALLPRGSPAVAGYDIAGWNRPADQTGGDYYDWQPLPDGRWIISLADVSGHGVGPALVTAACRAYMRASSRHDPQLASLLARVNRLLADDLPDGRFVTLVSVLVSPDGDPLRLLSAGHGPLLLWRAGEKRVEDIEPRDVPLAVVPEMTFGPDQSIAMQPADVLALVTDGFFEWTRVNDGGEREQYGLDRLRDSLARHAHLDAAPMVEALAADASAFGGSEPQQDDLTIVILKRAR